MDLPDPGIEPGTPALQVDSFPTDYQGSHVLLGTGKLMCVLMIVLTTPAVLLYLTVR